MTRSRWILVAGLALLLSTLAMTWNEAHRPWQSWQARFNAQPGVTPVPIAARALVPTQTGKPELCITCHVGIEDISPSHPAQAIGCVVCHGGEALSLDATRAHATMRGGRNPSDLSVAAASCGTSSCHGGYTDEEQNHVDRVMKSVQATYAGGIAAMRYAFGAQTSDGAELGIHRVEDRSRSLPSRALAMLRELPTIGDLHPIDLRLQQGCLTSGCHLSSPPLSQPYYYRSTGCAACHYLYDDDGLYRGKDPTIPRDRPGHGAKHQLTTAIPFSQCNHCHNRGNYSLKQMAFLPREDLPPLGAPIPEQMPPEGRQLIEYYQPIAQFTKCEYELSCADCHTPREVMGDGHIYGSKKDAHYVQCQTCHGTPTSQPRTGEIQDSNELAMRQARINGHPEFLAVGDQVVQTARGELLWSVKQIAPGQLVQLDKVTGQIYQVPQVMGTRCLQDGSTQAADYCHECHYVTR